jgi:hypothetical protein
MTTEGQQNFAETSDNGDYFHGEAEEFSLPSFGQTTPRQDQTEAVDDVEPKWTAVAETKVPRAAAMRRVKSKSSTGSHKNRTLKVSTKKGRTRVQSALSQDTSRVPNLDIADNASAYQDGTANNSQMVSVHQYVPREDPLVYYTGVMGLATDGLQYSHVNPFYTQVHMDYETSPPGNSPIASWDSLSSGESRTTSPGAPDDTWTIPLTSSPTESLDSPPLLAGQSPRYVVILTSSPPLAVSHDIRMNLPLDTSQPVTAEDLHTNVMATSGDDAFSLPPPFGARRPSGEGESARDHYLYKSALPGEDGLFHCPWEGEATCNHKPEKLKCNYE